MTTLTPASIAVRKNGKTKKTARRPVRSRKTVDDQSAGLISPREVSERLNIPLPTVYFHIRRRVLPCLRIGGRWRIDWNQVKERMATGWRPTARGIDKPAKWSSSAMEFDAIDQKTQSETMALLTTLPPREARPRYACLEPQVLGTTLSLTALHLCTTLQMVPVVLSDQGTSVLSISRDISVVFLGLDQLSSPNGLSVIEFACRGMEIVLVLLLPATYDPAVLCHLPDRMPIILCPAGKLSAAADAISKAMRQLSA